MKEKCIVKWLLCAVIPMILGFKLGGKSVWNKILFGLECASAMMTLGEVVEKIILKKKEKEILEDL